MDPHSASARTIGEGRHLRLLDRGGWEYASRLRSREVVGVVAFTVDDRLLLVEQDRPAVGGPTIELPAGLVGDEGRSGEAAVEAAKRELLEETGHTARQWQRLWRGAASSGLTDEMVTLFAARGVERVAAGGGCGDERITLHAVPRGELEAWLEARAAEGFVIDIKVPLALLVPPNAAGD
jgi:ADP-ribose pyrophosphatase